jgi:hypothetical protein
MANYCIVFRGYSDDVHQHKDPGKIIRYLRDRGHNVELYSSKNVQIDGVKNIHSNSLLLIGIILILRLFKRETKYLFFHLKKETIILANVLLCFKPVIVKMDNCNRAGPYPWENWLDKSITPNNYYYYRDINDLTRAIYRFGIQRIFRAAALVTVEDEGTLEEYKNKYSISCPFEVLPNLSKPCKTALKKQNLIVHIARIGDSSKNSKLVVESFQKSDLSRDHILVLAGSMTDEFSVWFNQECLNNVYYVGVLNNVDLNLLYSFAKILYLPSRVETFANVFGEALSFGLNIISSENTAISNYRIPGLSIASGFMTQTWTATLNRHKYINYDVVLEWYKDFHKKSNNISIYE